MVNVLWPLLALVVIATGTEMAMTPTPATMTSGAPMNGTANPGGTYNGSEPQYLPILGDDPLGLKPKVPGSEYAPPPGSFAGGQQQERGGVDGAGDRVKNLGSDSGGGNQNGDKGNTVGKEGFDQGAASVGYDGDNTFTSYKMPSRPFMGFNPPQGGGRGGK
ncbi:hypothetical protein HDE_04897 [Halotydeus destructor]|nr:hypothetical protein HDE_04897 [Halotydeus destructor]